MASDDTDDEVVVVVVVVVVRCTVALANDDHASVSAAVDSGD